MSNAITAIMPVMDIEAALSRRNAMVEYVQRIMVSGVDYGTIPGTGSKPTLLKPGAEKLSSMFALRPTFPVVEAVQDWTGENHGGEPFFSYWYKCILWRGDEPVGEGDGSCNSWEKKYRYRKAERACPACGALSIMRSKYPPKNDPNGQPGWYCRDCKAQFPATDPAITAQLLGYVPNTDVADQVNTLQKMAQKRALIAAVLVTCNASEFFTQDLEDIAEGEFHEVDAPAKANGQQTRPAPAQPAQPAANANPDPLIATWQAQAKNFAHAPNVVNGQWGAVQAIITGIAGNRDARLAFYSKLFGRPVASGDDLAAPERAWLHSYVKPFQDKTNGGWHANQKAESDLISFIIRHDIKPSTPPEVEQESMLADAAAANEHSTWGAQAL